MRPWRRRPEIRDLRSLHVQEPGTEIPDAITEAQALRLLLTRSVRSTTSHPAAIVFEMRDGRKLTYWRDSPIEGDAWTLSR